MSLDDKLISISDGIDALEERLTALEEKPCMKIEHIFTEDQMIILRKILSEFFLKRIEALEERVNTIWCKLEEEDIFNRLDALEDRCNKCEQITMERETDIYQRIEDLEERVNTIWCKLEEEDIFNRLDAYKNKIEALESVLKEHLKSHLILCEDGIWDPFDERCKSLLKQLEGK